MGRDLGGQGYLISSDVAAGWCACSIREGRNRANENSKMKTRRRLLSRTSINSVAALVTLGKEIEHSKEFLAF